MVGHLACDASGSRGAIILKTTSSEKPREDGSFLVRCEAVSGIISGASHLVFEFELCPGCSYPTHS